MFRTIGAFLTVLAICGSLFSPAMPVNAQSAAPCEQLTILPDLLLYETAASPSSPLAGKRFQTTLPNPVGYLQMQIAADLKSVDLAQPPTPAFGGFSRYAVTPTATGITWSSQAFKYELSVVGEGVELKRTEIRTNTDLTTKPTQCMPLQTMGGVTAAPSAGASCAAAALPPTGIDFSSADPALAGWSGTRQLDWKNFSSQVITTPTNGKIQVVYSWGARSGNPRLFGYNVAELTPTSNSVVLSTDVGEFTFVLNSDGTMRAVMKAKDGSTETVDGVPCTLTVGPPTN